MFLNISFYTFSEPHINQETKLKIKRQAKKVNVNDIILTEQEKDKISDLWLFHQLKFKEKREIMKKKKLKNSQKSN